MPEISRKIPVKFFLQRNFERVRFTARSEGYTRGVAARGFRAPRTERNFDHRARRYALQCNRPCRIPAWERNPLRRRNGRFDAILIARFATSSTSIVVRKKGNPTKHRAIESIPSQVFRITGEHAIFAPYPLRGSEPADYRIDSV